MNTAYSHKNILITLCVVVALVLGALYFGLNTIIQTNKTIADSSHTLVVEKQKQQAVSSVAALIATANPDIARVNNSVVSTDGDVTFIELLESTAATYKLQVVIDSLSLADDPTLAGSNMDVLQVKAEVKGSWQNVYLFTSRIESLPYVVKMNGIDIVNTKDMTNIDPTKQTPAGGPWQEQIDMNVLKRTQ